MYRVLSTRSLKFSEQRARKHAPKESGGGGGGGSSGTSSTKTSSSKKHNPSHDFHSLVPSRPTTPPALVAHGSGEHVAPPPPMLGYRRDDDAVVVKSHDKKTKHDQLTLRIKTHMETHKLASSMLVDTALQKKRDKLHKTCGVWAALGQPYEQRGAPAVDIVEAQQGQPIRELTRSSSARAPLPKESSDARRRFDTIVGLFQNSRASMRRGTVEAKKGAVEQRRKSSIAPSPMAAQQYSNSNSNSSSNNNGDVADKKQAWSSSPVSSSVPPDVSDAPSHHNNNNNSHDDDEADVRHLVTIDGDLHKKHHSASQMKERTKEQERERKKAELSRELTSVERIAQLQSKYPTHVFAAPLNQPLPVSLSLSPLTSPTNAIKSPMARNNSSSTINSNHHVGHSSKLARNGILRAASVPLLPPSHPANTHANTIHPLILNEMEVQRKEQEKMKLAAAKKDKRLQNQHSTSFNSYHRQLEKLKQSLAQIDMNELTPQQREKFQMKEHRLKVLAVSQSKYDRRKKREQNEKKIYEQVIQLLNKSRLENLHRWRNSFDATKQRLDRTLIQELVVRTESRNANSQHKHTSDEESKEDAHSLSHSSSTPLISHSASHTSLHSSSSPPQEHAHQHQHQHQHMYEPIDEEQDEDDTAQQYEYHANKSGNTHTGHHNNVRFFTP